ncbi:DMT family transporter [Eubacterium aggregans]|uniref:DMT family transporter n=1 Tax=Eubacterium aggregans TaxID=81409 RepID=UPI003F2B700A
MNKSAGLSVLLAASFWGIIGVFVNTLTAMGFTNSEIIFVRVIMTTLCIFGWLFIKDREAIPIKVKDIWIFMEMGILSFVCYNLRYLQCIAITGMSVAAVLLYTSPIFVMLFSIVLFKESMTRAKGIALFLAFGGCVLVTGIIGDNGRALTLTGILLGLGSGLGYSLYTVFGHYGVARYNSFAVTAWAFLFGTLGILPFVDFGQMLMVMANSPLALALILLCGLGTTVLPYTCYTYGLAKMEGSKAAILACLSPVVATIVGVLVYGEPITLTSTLGIVLVIGAVGVLNRG